MNNFETPLMDAIFKHIMQTNKDILATIITNVIEDISYDEALKGTFINVELVKNKVKEKGKFADLIYQVGNYIITMIRFSLPSIHNLLYV